MIASASLVGIGGSIGAVLRYLVGEYVEYEAFPLPVFLVNVIGSFVAGLVVFGVQDERVVQLVAVGVCGSFTTFSSFSFEAVHLWEHDRKFAAVFHAFGNLVACLGAVVGAWLLVAAG